jgi:hypothetical protein
VAVMAAMAVINGNLIFHSTKHSNCFFWLITTQLLFFKAQSLFALYNSCVNVTVQKELEAFIVDVVGLESETEVKSI